MPNTPQLKDGDAVTVSFRSDFGTETATGRIVNHPYGTYVDFNPPVAGVTSIALSTCTLLEQPAGTVTQADVDAAWASAHRAPLEVEQAAASSDELVPLVTPAGNGYALVVRTPTGLVATLMTPQQAEQHFDAGTNYVEQPADEHVIDAVLGATDQQPCVDCGRPVIWDEPAGDYRHVTGLGCPMALPARKPGAGWVAIDAVDADLLVTVLGTMVLDTLEDEQGIDDLRSDVERISNTLRRAVDRSTGTTT